MYLHGLATATVAGVAGCSGTSASRGGTGDTYLSEPDLDGEPEDYPYPVHGQQLPEVTLRDPIAGRDVTTTEFDRDTFVTFFYSNCMTVCPRLIGALRNVQAEAGKDGYADDIVILAITFDPERDTGDTLEAYTERMNVDMGAGNWRFLRPSNPAEAESIVTDTFGVNFRRTHPEGMDRYMFNHTGLILLANGDNYVERAYSSSTPSWKPMYDDLETLRQRGG